MDDLFDSNGGSAGLDPASSSSGILPTDSNGEPGSYSSGEIYSVNESSDSQNQSLATTAAGSDPLTGSDGAGNDRKSARDIGILSGSVEFTDAVGTEDRNDYYKFQLSEDDSLTMYVNKEAGGATLQLIDVNGSVIKSSTNKGTDGDATTGGSITESLAAGTYYARVTPWSKWTESNIDYTLTLQSPTSPPPPEDGSEDNNPPPANEEPTENQPPPPVNDQPTEYDIGTLSDAREFTDDLSLSNSNDYYKFQLSATQTISAFVNGLAAGTTVELLDSARNVIQSSTNQGTTWSETNSGSTGGSLSRTLAAGTYYVHITPGAMNGNALYDDDSEYTLTLQPHDAPNTVCVAASNAVNKGGADYFATGTNDEEVINEAIAEVGGRGGGTVLLVGGTFNIAESILMTYDNVTLTGIGWSTVLKQANNVEFEDAGMLRSAYHTDAENLVKESFSNQHFKHFSLDGNKANQTTAHNSYGNFGTYTDSSFEDLRVHDFGSYGLDPHENSVAEQATVRLTIKDSLVDHNGKDGITIDNCVDSLIEGNISDSNARHGMNICTDSDNNTFLNNATYHNGGNGITIQSGTDLSYPSDENRLIGNISRFNKQTGIYLYLGQNTLIENNTVTDNGRHGIRLRSASFNTVKGNILRNNSQEEHNKYNEIYLDNNGVTYSTNNSIENNNILDNLTNRAKYGIAERSASDDYNTLSGNVIQGTVKPVKLLGPNSRIVV